MKGDETERRIADSASTPAEAAAAIFFYRRGDATDVTGALKLADSLENSLDQDDMVIVRRGDLTLNQPRNLIGRRVVWRHPDPDTTDTPRRYGEVVSALVRFGTVGELPVSDGDDVRLVVPHVEAQRHATADTVRGALDWWLYAHSTGDTDGGSYEAAEAVLGAELVRALDNALRGDCCAACGWRDGAHAHGCAAVGPDEYVIEDGSRTMRPARADDYAPGTPGTGDAEGEEMSDLLTALRKSIEAAGGGAS